MTEKIEGPLPTPDAKWHRKRDAEFASNLITRTGMSLNKVALQLGVGARWLRYVAEGKEDLPYTVQYALEALANRFKKGEPMNAIREPVASYGAAAATHRPQTVWLVASDRKLTDDDAGKIVVGKDRFGAGVCGTLIRDQWGLVVRELHPQAVDVRDVPADRLIIYTLIDPPTRDEEALARHYTPTAPQDDEPPSHQPGGFQTHVRRNPPRR